MTPPPPATALRRVPAPQRPDHLRVIPGGSPDREASRHRIKPWAAAVATGCVLFSLVFSSVFQGQLSIDQTRLERRMAQLRTDIGEVELSVTRAHAPNEIAKRAIGLGLVFPEEFGALPPREVTP